MIDKNRQEPSKSENDKVSVENSLNGSGWFRLVPGVEMQEYQIRKHNWTIRDIQKNFPECILFF